MLLTERLFSEGSSGEIPLSDDAYQEVYNASNGSLRIFFKLLHETLVGFSLIPVKMDISKEDLYLYFPKAYQNLIDKLSKNKHYLPILKFIKENPKSSLTKIQNSLGIERTQLKRLIKSLEEMDAIKSDPLELGGSKSYHILNIYYFLV